MSNVFTDDYLIGTQFHTLEGSTTFIMRRCLIKVAFRTREILSAQTSSSLSRTLVFIRDCVTSSQFDSQLPAYTLWGKESVLGGILWFFIITLRQLKNRWLVLKKVLKNQVFVFLFWGWM